MPYILWRAGLNLATGLPNPPNMGLLVLYCTRQSKPPGALHMTYLSIQMSGAKQGHN